MTRAAALTGLTSSVRRSWIAAIAALLILFIALVLAAPEARSNTDASGAHLGVASCAGSTCHGRMAGDGPVVRQDEISIWQEPSTAGGAHSRAYAVLSNSRSQFIARNLGIADAASAPMCLGCHSSSASASGGNFRYQLSDGVNCESCHGGASGWISSHYAGLLGSGDSGGGAWIETDAGWAIAGVNGDGSGQAQYGDTSGFARVSGHVPWITAIFPGARIE